MANLLSYSRILLAFVLIYLVQTRSLSTALAVIVVAAVTDYLDGFVARKTETISAFGAILDPIADRIFILSLCAALLIRFWQLPLFKLASILLIARESLISLGFLWLKTKSKKMAVTRLGKAATAFVFISFVVVFVLPKVGIYFLVVAITLYWISALDYARNAWGMLEKN